jgi:HAD superfamily hydrolase (TIGR01509 family)
MKPPSHARRKLTAVLLDVDGTLIDSNDAHARSWSEALAAFDVTVKPSEVRPLIGMGGDKLVPRLLGEDAESAKGKKFTERRAAIFRERYVPKLRLTPGAGELVTRLRGEGYRLVIATSANEEELEVMLKQVGLDDLLPNRTSSSEAESSKPDPDIVQAALRRGNVAANEAVMLGDTPYDVEAAARAGVDSVALLCGGWDYDALAGAIAIYRDPADLLHHFTSSPFSCVAPDPDRSGPRKAGAP